jgi:hypothetical protein
MPVQSLPNARLCFQTRSLVNVHAYHHLGLNELSQRRMPEWLLVQHFRTLGHLMLLVVSKHQLLALPSASPPLLSWA